MKGVHPDILLAAKGVPRQEFWIASRLTSDRRCMVIAVGACSTS